MELDLFAACLPGLEPLLADELRSLGAVTRKQDGGVSFRGTVELLFQAHLHLGTASHLLLRCGTFRCLNLGQLQNKAAQLPWRAWLRGDQPFEVRATAKKSRLYHTDAIAERVQRGVALALGHNAARQPVPATATKSHAPMGQTQKLAPTARPAAAATPPAVDAGPPCVQIAVRFEDDVATVSIDTSATPLHRRGYRLESAKAPLREDLAHALLRAAGFARGTALLDPFCGAGTIAIEAAGLVCGLPPGRLRPPPLQGTALADDARWQALLTALPANPTQALPDTAIAASDRDAGAIAAARGNADRAGVAAAIAWQQCAITAAPWLANPEQAPKPLLLATNPPFGQRVGHGKDLGNLYQTLGHRSQRLGDQVRIALLAHDLRLARRIGSELKVAFATRHGGLRVAALLG